MPQNSRNTKPETFFEKSNQDTLKENSDSPVRIPLKNDGNAYDDNSIVHVDLNQ